MKKSDTALLVEIVDPPPKLHAPLCADTFLRTKDDQSSEILLELYHSYVLIRDPKIEENSKLQKITFSFDVIFEIIREKTQADKKGETGELDGIKFQKFGKSSSFYNSDAQVLRKWRQHLSQRLNQRGFHTLFKPVKKIGKGNFASVYLAIRLQDDRKCAVKAFSKQATYAEDKGKESLVNEIELMRKLNHKNLLRLYEVYESQNSIYVCLQLLEGGQLYDKIKAKHKFTASQTHQVIKGLLMGAAEMKELRIMHRDIKPENILLRSSDDYDCVIADFGLSEECDKNEYLFVRCGTPGYVAPQVVNIKDLTVKIDPICDVFSIGIIFHILLLGKSPFPGKTYNQVLSQNRACQFFFDKPEYDSVDRKALDLLKKMLQKDPSKRVSAEDALEHEYFEEENVWSEGKHSVESILTQTEKQPKHKTSILSEEGSLNSPLLTTKNPLRKLNQEPLKEDSCLKFVMKENVLTGHVDSQELKENDSPSIIKKLAPLKHKQSRFGLQNKQLAEITNNTPA